MTLQLGALRDALLGRAAGCLLVQEIQIARTSGRKAGAYMSPFGVPWQDCHKLRRTTPLKTMITILALAMIGATSSLVCAGDHFENGHWVVTSAKREKQFNDCIDNAQKMDAETEECMNKRDEEIREGRATPETPLSDKCEGKVKSYLTGQLPCLAGLKNPKFGGDDEVSPK
jgi:hypothetical protein